jgi:hypothetical protein
VRATTSHNWQDGGIVVNLSYGSCSIRKGQIGQKMATTDSISPWFRHVGGMLRPPRCAFGVLMRYIAVRNSAILPICSLTDRVAHAMQQTEAEYRGGFLNHLCEVHPANESRRGWRDSLAGF